MDPGSENRRSAPSGGPDFFSSASAYQDPPGKFHKTHKTLWQRSHSTTGNRPCKWKTDREMALEYGSCVKDLTKSYKF